MEDAPSHFRDLGLFPAHARVLCPDHVLVLEGRHGEVNAHVTVGDNLRNGGVDDDEELVEDENASVRVVDDKMVVVGGEGVREETGGERPFLWGVWHVLRRRG